MNTVHRWLASILCSAMLVLLVSCATPTPNPNLNLNPATDYIPNDSTVQNMSVEDARNVLVTEMKGKIIMSNGSHGEIADVRVTSDKLIVTDVNGKQSTFMFKRFPKIISKNKKYRTIITVVSQKNVYGQIYFNNFTLKDGFVSLKEYGAIANALYVLKQDSIKKTKRDAEEYDASFEASLADYRKKAASNAALPEETRKYKVQAEGAVRDKAFDEAADFYVEALKIAPWWSVGHFNRALVLSETGDYGEAKREMNYYLQLVPDAPNARAAQDKIYEWERLESK